MLDEFDLQVLGAAGEHPPHRAGLGAGEVAEDGVAEVPVGGVEAAIVVAVAAIEGLVQALHDVRVVHGPTLSDCGLPPKPSRVITPHSRLPRPYFSSPRKRQIAVSWR